MGKDKVTCIREIKVGRRGIRVSYRERDKEGLFGCMQNQLSALGPPPDEDPPELPSEDIPQAKEVTVSWCCAMGFKAVDFNPTTMGHRYQLIQIP